MFNKREVKQDNQGDIKITIREDRTLENKEGITEVPITLGDRLCFLSSGALLLLTSVGIGIGGYYFALWNQARFDSLTPDEQKTEHDHNRAEPLGSMGVITVGIFSASLSTLSCSCCLFAKAFQRSRQVSRVQLEQKETDSTDQPYIALAGEESVSVPKR